MRSTLIGALALAIVLLAGCGKPGAPTLAVVDSPLGEYNALPAFTWAAADPGQIDQAAFAIDSQEAWAPLAAGATTFRPDAPLSAGTHTVYLRVDGRGGWSDLTSLEFTVTELPTWTPDDEYYDLPNAIDISQWALPMIDMPLAWGALQTVFTQRDQVIVAVIDTGYTDHPDVVGNVLTDEGYDFISEESIANDGPDPGDTEIDPDAYDTGDRDPEYGSSWHGTSVAGTIASLTNNPEGTAGVAIDHVAIMPLRALGERGGYTYDIAQCILYAAGLANDSGTVPTTAAKIINMSLGSAAEVSAAGQVFDLFMGDALSQATAAGVISVAATGNSSDDPYWVPVGSPANLVETIAVGAIGDAAQIAYYSQMGAQLDVVAPGGDLATGIGVLLPSADPWATLPLQPGDYGYAEIQGTSFACPHVAGVLAVLATIDPEIDLATARELLRRSSANLDPPLVLGDFEVGILNAASVLETHFGGRFAYSGERPDFSWARSLTAPQPQLVAPLSETALADPAFVDQGRLIVRFTDQDTVELMEASGMRGIRSITGRTGTTRLLSLDAAGTLQQMREDLLTQPGVETVYYNYRYLPL